MSWGASPRLSSAFGRDVKGCGLRGDGGSAMCTTILILGPLVLLLRRRFCNKVEPYVLSCPLLSPQGPGAGAGRVRGGPGVENLILNLCRIHGDIWVLSGFGSLGDTRGHFLELGRE